MTKGIAQRREWTHTHTLKGKGVSLPLMDRGDGYYVTRYAWTTAHSPRDHTHAVQAGVVLSTRTGCVLPALDVVAIGAPR